MPYELTHDSMVQSLLIMLRAANKQNKQVTESLNTTRRQNTALVDHVNNVNNMSAKIAELETKLATLDGNWMMTSSAVCALSSYTGMSDPMPVPVAHRLVQIVTKAAVQAPVSLAPVTGRDMFDSVPRRVIGRQVAARNETTASASRGQWYQAGLPGSPREDEPESDSDDLPDLVEGSGDSDSDDMPGLVENSGDSDSDEGPPS